VAIALGATILLVFFTFGRMRDRLLTLGSLLLGVVVMTGLCAALGLKLNFLNFVAFPVTFGIGSDYGVNVMRRFVEEEGAGAELRTAIRAAVEETGGAVILCSLTTIIGYLSLFTSPNRALNSFGLAMVISEIACLLAAVLALPALMAILFRNKKRHSAQS
jgi:predicted RND superfamily exporter protein